MSNPEINPSTHPQLQEPSFHDSKAMVVAGPDIKNISALWQRSGPSSEKLWAKLAL